MTDHQQAIADGLAELSASQASAWTFGAFTFAGAESELKPYDPRMIGAPALLIEVRVLTSALPDAYPKRGQEMTRDGETHMVHKVEHNHAAGVSVFLVHRSSLPSRWLAFLTSASGAAFTDGTGATISG